MLLTLRRRRKGRRVSRGPSPRSAAPAAAASRGSSSPIAARFLAMAVPYAASPVSGVAGRAPLALRPTLRGRHGGRRVFFAVGVALSSVSTLVADVASVSRAAAGPSLAFAAAKKKMFRN